MIDQRHPPKPKNPWKDWQLRFLKSQWQHMTGMEIGKHLGRTRSAICGKANRLGLRKKTEHPVVKSISPSFQPRHKEGGSKLINATAPMKYAPPVKSAPENIWNKPCLCGKIALPRMIVCYGCANFVLSRKATKKVDIRA